MKKILTYSAIGILIALGLIIVIFDDPSITTAAIGTYTKCVDPSQALDYINNQGCTRIYEDPNCKKAEIRCPTIEAPEPAVEEQPDEEPEPTTTRSRESWRNRAKKGKPFYNFGQFLRGLLGD